MGTAMIILTAICGAIVTIALGLVKDEVASWLPRIVDLVLASAVRRLPDDKQLRYEEEWRSHILEYPGKLGQLFQACNIYVASFRLPRRKAKTWGEYTWEVIRSLDRCAKLLAFSAPIYLSLLALEIYLGVDHSVAYHIYQGVMVFFSIVAPVLHYAWLRKFMIRSIDLFPYAKLP